MYVCNTWCVDGCSVITNGRLVFGVTRSFPFVAKVKKEKTTKPTKIARLYVYTVRGKLMAIYVLACIAADDTRPTTYAECYTQYAIYMWRCKSYSNFKFRFDSLYTSYDNVMLYRHTLRKSVLRIASSRKKMHVLLFFVLNIFAVFTLI